MTSEDANELNYTEDEWQWLRAHGAQTILEQSDISDLRKATARVFELMLDRQWHSPDEICAAAGGREGLRRLREVRQVIRQWNLVIEKRKVSKRLFYYRLTDPADPENPAAVDS
jgi:hypothetical protein